MRLVPLGQFNYFKFLAGLLLTLNHAARRYFQNMLTVARHNQAALSIRKPDFKNRKKAQIGAINPRFHALTPTMFKKFPDSRIHNCASWPDCRTMRGHSSRSKQFAFPPA